MKRLIPLAALLAAAPALAQGEPQLTLDQKAMLRCSATFAIIANEQARGIASAKKWPDLTERGKEYFVRAGAKLIESHKLTHEQIDALYRAQIKQLMNESATARDPQLFVNNLMQPCLLSLDAAGI